jgi:hypothetical protein
VIGSLCAKIKVKIANDKQVQTDLHSTDVFFAKVLQGKNDLVIRTVQLSKKQNYPLEQKNDMEQFRTIVCTMLGRAGAVHNSERIYIILFFLFFY